MKAEPLKNKECFYADSNFKKIKVYDKVDVASAVALYQSHLFDIYEHLYKQSSPKEIKLLKEFVCRAINNLNEDFVDVVEKKE